jgi:hypothetical protein
MSASAVLTVDVLDVQDNAPVFERAAYHAEIAEDAPVFNTIINNFMLILINY